ncbi:hypothetical protein ABZO31_19560 [Streptomyces sp. HUAS MG47]|uniref:hypothetical protein n=1 Tax=Streptomyces solicamelliae TaxID=3231716 RepID=UPI003877C067
MAEDQCANGAGAELRGMIEAFGKPFVEWLLGDISEVSPEQEEMAKLIAEKAPFGTADGVFFGWGPMFCAPRNGETSPIAHMRRLIGAAEGDNAPSSGDVTLDALNALAAEMYGAFLLEGKISLPFAAPVQTPLEEAAVEAVRRDPDLPFDASSDLLEAVQLSQGIGFSGGVQLVAVPSSIIYAAWSRAKLRDCVPDLTGLRESVKWMLREARSGYSRRHFTAIGVASLSGVVGPVDVRLELPWGVLRSAHGSDRPRVPRVRDGGDRTIQGGDDENAVTIRYSGDVILETEVKCSAKYAPVADISEDSIPSLDMRCQHILSERVNLARLAFLLSWEGEDVPVVIPGWSKFVVPVRQGEGWQSSNPDRYAMLRPTAVSREQMADWQEWIARLSSVNFRRLGIAPQRLLRASAERRDHLDALIDAVIVWESLLGADREITYRVSAALSKLLYAGFEERSEFRKRATDIYRLRSQIVHGVDVRSDKVASASRDAIRIAKRALRSLVLDRPDLIPMSSEERSNRLILE